LTPLLRVTTFAATMPRLGVLLLLLGMSAQAAEVTRVASSFDDNKPFGMFIDVEFQRTQDKGKITREWYEPSTGLTDVSELRYVLYDTRLNLDAHLGLYKDLEFHFGLPIVFQQDRVWSFSQGTTPDRTTLYRNCGSATAGTGCDLAADQGHGRGRLFEIGDSSASYRGGLGDLTFGLAYAFFSQARDDTKPTWVVSVDYTAPTATLNNPSEVTATDKRGGIGDRVHRYKFATSISKRIGPLDPYFQLHYTMPWRGPGYYSNCDDPSNAGLGSPGNCGRTVPWAGHANAFTWDRAETGIRPPHVGGFLFGGEFNAFERAAMHQKIAFDVRAWLTYTSEGRYNNELSDLTGKLLYSSDYMQIGGHLGFTGHAAEFIHLKAYFSWAYNTEHFLTSETIGQDLNGSQSVDISKDADLHELNPNFDNRMDRIGRRFRMAEQMIFKINVSASFNF
jgi:hypothetical protein